MTRGGLAVYRCRHAGHRVALRSECDTLKKENALLRQQQLNPDDQAETNTT